MSYEHQAVLVRPVVIDIDDVAYLHSWRPGATEPQPAHLVLQLHNGELTAEYEHHFHHELLPPLKYRALRWNIPVLQAQAANELITEVIPLAQEVLDGDNGALSDRAHFYAATVIPNAIAAFDRPENVICDLEAATWLTAGNTIPMSAVATTYGITKSTTDAEIAEKARDIDVQAATDPSTVSYLVLLGTIEYLRRVRAFL